MVVLDLGPVSESLTGWVPGAHIAVHLPSGKVRQYSLCGDLGAHGIYRKSLSSGCRDEVDLRRRTR